MPNPSPLRVLFLCAEADPLVKVGSLGEVGGSLPTAIQSLYNLANDGGSLSQEVDIRVVLPFHGSININRYKAEPVASFQVPHTSGPIKAQAYGLMVNHVQFYLIAGDPIHSQSPVYSSDLGFDAHKYIFYSLAAVELARQLNWQPHVLHANDWHSAAAIYWLFLHRQADPFFQNTVSIQSIHNLHYLGIGADFPMDSFYLPACEANCLPGWARHIPLPLALLTADHITTVSPTYTKEIFTPGLGCGLEDLLQRRASQLSGILNGIDDQAWNPADDPAIPVTYTPDSLFVRAANKVALLNELGLLETDTGLAERNPLLAISSPMDFQAGADLAIDALYELSRQESMPWRAILLGTGLPDLEQSGRRLQWYLPDRVRAVTRQNIALTHRIYAGADLLMVPARSEPCGTAQMIAQRYGCVPVAHATGSIQDSIRDYLASPDSTGFLFSDPTPQALVQALRAALAVYRIPAHWKALQQRGMLADFSWKRAAQEYLHLYNTLVVD